MNAIRMSIIGAVLLTSVTAAAGLDSRLEDLAPFVGKTFEGEFVDQMTGKDAVDVQHWESILGGKAVRVVHSLNQGEYGGETVIIHDNKLESLVFYYFTTAGFYTQGTIEFADGVFTTHETVEGAAEGITEVRSTSRILEDGRLHMKAEFLKDGEWVPGHEIFYEENPGAKVVFK